MLVVEHDDQKINFILPSIDPQDRWSIYSIVFQYRTSIIVCEFHDNLDIWMN